MSREAQKITSDFVDSNRRSEPRSALLYRPVIIETDGYTGFCLVKNISSGGFQGIVFADLGEGQPITIQFPTGAEAHGTVAWSKNEAIGVQFDEQIDVAQVLHDLGQPTFGDKVNRAPRVSIEKPAILVARDKRESVHLHDLSQRGAKVTAPSLTLGDDVVLHLDGLRPCIATVRWVQAGMAGLAFHLPLPFDDLARWVITQRAEA